MKPLKPLKPLKPRTILEKPLAHGGTNFVCCTIPGAIQGRPPGRGVWPKNCGLCPSRCIRTYHSTYLRRKTNGTGTNVQKNEGLIRETQEIVLSTLAEKQSFEGLPRAPECTDRARPSTSVSGRPSRVDYSAFSHKLLVPRDMLGKIRKKHQRNYACVDVVGRMHTHSSVVMFSWRA